MFGAMVRKEIQLLRRDPRAIIRLLVLPVAFIALFGMAFKQSESEPTSEPLPIYADASAALAEPVQAALAGSKIYKLVARPSADAVRAAVASGDFDVGLIIPAGFDPAHGGKRAEVVFDTGKSPIEQQQAVEPLREIIEHVTVGEQLEAIDIVPPPGLGAPLEKPSSFQLTVPGNAVLFGFFIALTCALSFAEERRTGTWRRLLASPVSRWQLLVAKLVPYIVLGSLQVGLLFVIGVFAFGMQINGSIAALVVLTIGVATCATSLGLALASFSATEKQISSLGSVVILIMGLVGGCMLPRALMPHTMQLIGLFVPHGWALDGYSTLLVRTGSTFGDVARQIGAVWGFAALFLYVGVKRFRFDE